MEYKPELVNAVSQNLPLYLADRAAGDVLARLNDIYEQHRLDEEPDPAKRRAIFLKEAERRFPLPAGFSKAAKARHVLSAILLEQPEFEELGRKLFGPLTGTLLQAAQDELAQGFSHPNANSDYLIDLFFAGVDRRVHGERDLPGNMALIVLTLRTAFPSLNSAMRREAERSLRGVMPVAQSQPTDILDEGKGIKPRFNAGLRDVLREDRQKGKGPPSARPGSVVQPPSEGIAPPFKKEP